MTNQEDEKIKQHRLQGTAFLGFLDTPGLVLRLASTIAVLVGCSVIAGWALNRHRRDRRGGGSLALAASGPWPRLSGRVYPHAGEYR